MEAQRIQRKRTKGWKKPYNTISVSRPSSWGNPFNWQDEKGPTDFAKKKSAVENFEINLSPADFEAIKRELRGKNLMCWCKIGEPCHADVLIQIANAN